MPISVGCAGWSLSGRAHDLFPGDGTHLERYASRLHAVEINTSFYRPHRPQTYARWADSTPAGFRFAVKVPKTITHEHRLAGAEDELARFLDEAGSLGEKLGPLLVQLPPSLKWEAGIAEAFFGTLRQQTQAPIVCEPRHPTWFTAECEQLLQAHHIARVAADPPPVPAAAHPAGEGTVAYFRLHGSPRMYYSAYDSARLAELAQRLLVLHEMGVDTWCIFDNTAEGAALENALELMGSLKSEV